MGKFGLVGTPASGAGIIKEDGQNDYVIAQLKSTIRDAITVHLSDVQVLNANAEIAHKLPVFILQFVNGPILLCVQPNDISAVAEYLNVPESNIEKIFKKNNSKVCTIHEKGDIIKPKVRSSKKRDRVLSQLRRERELKYEKEKERMKKKR